jgi:hypothetical protein
MQSFDRSRYLDAQGKKRDWYCGDVLSGALDVSVVLEDSAEALDGALLSSMLKAVQEAARSLGLDKAGFFVRAKAAAPGVTPHMHWHVIGPGVDPPPGTAS